MPIAYSCPHCGKQFSVAEQYAGQTGPCAGCGKTITIPLAAPAAGYAFAPPPGTSGGGTGVAAVVIGIVVLLLACPCVLGVLVALLLPAVQAARESARRMQSQNNLKQIVLALHNYHDSFGSFPPAVVTDADGKPLYSGRVLLLPFLEQQNVYQQFDLTQPWDSPQNLAISQAIGQDWKVFRDPSSPNPPLGQTDYLFVTGTGTVFEAGKTTKLMDITDGTSNTMVIVERRGSGVNWAQPQDLDMSQLGSLPPGNHPGGNLVGMADGSVRFMSKTVSPGTVRAMATRNGGEAVNPP
jgi:type II secretory pathway pseudopilin PulG